MNDDWRLEVRPRDAQHGNGLVDRLRAKELEHDLSVDFADKVIVSREEGAIFLYAGSREQVERARDVVAVLGREHRWDLECDVKQWHPTAEDWEDPSDRLLQPHGTATAEHEALMRTEDRETEERGYPEFEVRIDLGSHHEAAALAKRLRDEGIPNVHRWRFVLVGASDEDVAKELAERIQSEVTPGTKVAVEGTWKALYSQQPRSPFSFIGDW